MRRTLLLAPALLGAAIPALVAAQTAKPRYGTWGIDLADMDRTVKPGDDFFAYVEGTWLKNHPIAPDKSSAGYNSEVPDEAEQQVRQIIEEAQTRPDGPIARKVGDYYAAWMDEAGVEARGLAPVRPFLQQIDAVATVPALVRLMMQPGFPAPVGFGIGADVADPTRYQAQVGQGRLGLPTRDYYLLTGEKYVAIRRAYRDYLVKIQGLAGLPDPAGRADRIVALETRIATDQWTPEQRRDPVRTHNPMTLAQLTALAPQYDWGPTLASIGLGATRIVNVGEPSAVKATGQRLADVPLATWKEWLTARFISDHASFLPHAFDAAQFDFYSHTLRDVPEQRARWKRGVALIDGAMGEAVGQIYTARYWTPETERQANELVADMRAAYGEKIAHAIWMDAPTRAAAQAKLASFDPRVGHPAKWTDYSSLAVTRTDPLANDVAADQFQWRLALARYPHPVARYLWDMTPQTVNAYYDPTLNQVTVPAAILQPPFFDASADPAINYGETGATTFGHEMGHGFDDEGRQFDERGRLRDWWTPATAAKYTVQADRLAAQFDGYEPIPGVHIKGKLTLGENLADLGGLETGYAAYRRYVARHGEPPVIDGFTGDQRFFLAYAAAWQGKTREGALRAQLLSNPHSPDKYRVNGIVRNFGPWYAAWGVKPGDALFLPPDQRVSVWGS